MNRRTYLDAGGPVEVWDFTGEPDALEARNLRRAAPAAVRLQVRHWSKGSARTAGPTQAAGVAAVRLCAGDIEPPGCAAGHSAARLAECDTCGEAWCTGPGCLEGSTVQEADGRRHRCPEHRHGPECYSQAEDRPGLACAHATATARHLTERLALYRAWRARVAARQARRAP